MDNYNENKYKLRIDALTQQLTKVGNEYYATVATLQAKNNELNETRHELNETRHELNETRHELNETRHELNETRHELNELLNSKSWKLTKPLRLTVKTLKLLRK